MKRTKQGEIYLILPGDVKLTVGHAKDIKLRRANLKRCRDGARKKKGFFAVLSGCFPCSFYEEQRRIFRLVSLTILYVFRCCPHGCISFLLFPKKGKFMLHFLPHCVQLLWHLLALTAHFQPVREVFLWIMYIYIYMGSCSSEGHLFLL